MDCYSDDFCPYFRANSLNSMLLEAMKDERNDRVKYENMMGMTNDENVKKQIKFAYDDEIKHYKLFQRIYYELTGKKVEIPLPTETYKYDNLMDAVKSSIEGENEAVELYRDIYSLLPSKKMRDTVYKIITDEQEHFGRFIYLNSMLK